jgi:hypothetical protein
MKKAVYGPLGTFAVSCDSPGRYATIRPQLWPVGCKNEGPCEGVRGEVSGWRTAFEVSLWSKIDSIGRLGPATSFCFSLICVLRPRVSKIRPKAAIPLFTQGGGAVSPTKTTNFPTCFLGGNPQTRGLELAPGFGLEEEKKERRNRFSFSLLFLHAPGSYPNKAQRH